MSRALCHPWWDPAEELVVETTTDVARGVAVMPCAACGEHTLVEVVDVQREPWLRVVCRRCIKLDDLVLRFVCRDGHIFKRTVFELRESEVEARVFHCPCRRGAREVTAHRLGFA